MAGHEANAFSAMYAQQAAQFSQYGTIFYPSTMHMGDEPRTLSITGFPLNMRDRELNNLLRFLPGYEVINFSIKLT